MRLPFIWIHVEKPQKLLPTTACKYPPGVSPFFRHSTSMLPPPQHSTTNSVPIAASCQHNSVINSSHSARRLLFFGHRMGPPNQPYHHNGGLPNPTPYASSSHAPTQTNHVSPQNPQSNEDHFQSLITTFTSSGTSSRRNPILSRPSWVSRMVSREHYTQETCLIAQRLPDTGIADCGMMNRP